MYDVIDNDGTMPIPMPMPYINYRFMAILLILKKIHLFHILFSYSYITFLVDIC